MILVGGWKADNVTRHYMNHHGHMVAYTPLDTWRVQDLPLPLFWQEGGRDSVRVFGASTTCPTVGPPAYAAWGTTGRGTQCGQRLLTVSSAARENCRWARSRPARCWSRTKEAFQSLVINENHLRAEASLLTNMIHLTTVFNKKTPFLLGVAQTFLPYLPKLMLTFFYFDTFSFWNFLKSEIFAHIACWRVGGGVSGQSMPKWKGIFSLGSLALLHQENSETTNMGTVAS